MITLPGFTIWACILRSFLITDACVAFYQSQGNHLWVLFDFTFWFLVSTVILRMYMLQYVVWSKLPQERDEHPSLLDPWNEEFPSVSPPRALNDDRDLFQHSSTFDIRE